MARVKEITCHYSGKINAGNFESIDFGYGETIALSPDDDVAVERGKMHKRVRAFFEAKNDMIRRDIEANAKASKRK